MDRVPYEQLDDHPDATDLCTLHGEPFTGVAYDVWPDGRLSAEWSFRNGEKWGPLREWHRNGRLAAASYLVAGVAHGAYRGWFDDGRKQFVELVQFGVTVRAKDWDREGRVTRDYALASEPGRDWYLGHLEEARRRYAALVEAENIPDEYLRVTEEDWS